MDEMHITGGNSFKIEGFIDIELISTKDNVRRTYKNTITLGGKQLLFNRSAGSLLKCGGDIFGQVYSYDNFIGQNRSTRYSSYNGCITNALLNLGSNSNLTEASTFANIYNSDFTSLDKVVGFASINLVPEANGKEGTIDYSKPAYVADGFTRQMRWKYPEGVASGTFDTIAMLGRGTLTTPYPVDNGVISAKCLDKVNVAYGNFGSLSTGYCPPGVAGITTNNEILLNFTIDNKSRWKYNISTGEITEVPDNEPFFLPIDSSDIGDYYIEGKYLYTLIVPKGTSGSSVTVNVWDITNQSKITTFTCAATNNTYGTRAKFLYYNSKLYVTISSESSGSTSTRRCWTLNKNSKGYYASATNGTSLVDTIGINLPSGLNLNTVCIGNYGDQYIVFISNTGLIVSNLNNVANSIINIIPHTTSNMIAYSAGGNTGFLTIGAPSGANNPNNDNTTINNYDSYWTFTMNNTGNKTVNVSSGGIFIIANGWWSSLMSFVKLTEPITKSDDQIMYIGYGYRIV